MQQSIQWFPGHMARTRRQLTEALPSVDIVAEIRDARIPESSRNPELSSLIGNKPRMVLLNKADLADERETKRWLSAYQAAGLPTLSLDCRSGKGLDRFLPMLKECLSDKRAAWQEKGMINRAIRVMVVGIPNVGKSSFINRLRSGAKAKVEDRPGVTRTQQWFVIDGGAQLLDTPGILWPKFDDQTVAAHLAFTGAIRDEILDTEELAWGLLGELRGPYEMLLRSRYKLEGDLPEDTWDLLQLIGKKRGMLVSGGEIDTLRVSAMILDEFRGGKIGRISLETSAT